MRYGKKAWLAGGAVALFLSGLLLGSAGSGQAGVQQVDLSHFKCYNIAEPFDPSHRVALQDQFGLERVAVGRAQWHCNPVKKRVLRPGPPPLDITGEHLVCYFINGELQPPVVALGNQLGVQENVPLRPARLLCVPSAKRVHPTPTRG